MALRQESVQRGKLLVVFYIFWDGELGTGSGRGKTAHEFRCCFCASVSEVESLVSGLSFGTGSEWCPSSPKSQSLRLKISGSGSSSDARAEIDTLSRRELTESEEDRAK